MVDRKAYATSSLSRTEIYRVPRPYTPAHRAPPSIERSVAHLRHEVMWLRVPFWKLYANAKRTVLMLIIPLHAPLKIFERILRRVTPATRLRLSVSAPLRSPRQRSARCRAPVAVAARGRALGDDVRRLYSSRGEGRKQTQSILRTRW